MYNKEWWLARRQKFLPLGICYKCGKEPIDITRSSVAGVVCIERQRATYKKWMSAPDRRKLSCDYQKARHKKTREAIITRYGGACVCCGEKEPMFLEFDHIYNDGAKTRHQSIVYWIKRNNYPNTICIMCANCNQGRARNGGICPHTLLKN